MACVSVASEQQRDIFSLVEPRPPNPEEPAADAGPFGVVVTGGSKGVGAALAAAFVARGDRVCVAARDGPALERAAAQLRRYARGSATVVSVPCDVAEAADVQRLMNVAKEQLGRIDLVICNAGTNAYLYQPLADSSPAALEQILLTNGVGTLLSCQAAIQVLRAQKSGGHIFVMKGAGSDGNPTRKYAAYGFSKAGMGQLARSLTAECREAQKQGGPPIGVHTLSPGLVYTELVDCGQDSFGKSGRFFVNMIAELPVDVAADLVPKLRAVAAEGLRAAARAPLAVEFLTPDKLLRKVYRRLAK
eukprot:EG_transcript_12817